MKMSVAIVLLLYL